MSKKYYLRYKGTVIGYFVDMGDKIDYVCEHENASLVPNGLGYPHGLYDFDSSMPHDVDTSRNPAETNIKSWIENRVFPSDREGLDKILDDLELDSYDPWEICKRMHGITMADYYWISENIEDQYELMHPRAALDNNDAIVEYKLDEKGAVKSLTIDFSKVSDTIVDDDFDDDPKRMTSF